MAPKGVDKTPADIAGIKLPFKTWTEFVRQDKSAIILPKGEV